MSSNEQYVDRESNIEDIVGNVPSRYILYTSASLLIVLIIGLILSHFIKYPEIISAPVLLKSDDAPIKIVARQPSFVDSLLIQDESNVTKGDILLTFHTEASFHDILLLRSSLQSNPKSLIDIHVLNVGEFAEQAVKYFNLVSEENFEIEIGLLENRKERLTNEKKSLQRRILIQEQNLDLIKQKNKIVYNDYQRTEKLQRDRVLAIVDLETKQKVSIDSKLEMLRAEEALLNSNSNLEVLNTSTKEIKMEIENARILRENSIQETYNSLISNLLKWEDVFILRSPKNGKVVFSKDWESGMFINSYEQIFWVEPDVDDLHGKIKVNQYNSSKIKIGQDVLAMLDNFPYEEYGMVKGKVESITKLPIDDSYIIEINFPNGMVTEYGYVLDLHSEAIGSVSIITENQSLLSKFFFKYRKIINSRYEGNKDY
jgi:hypothetical protein